MKAVQFDHFGNSEVLNITELADPAPKAGEVVVRVKAAGINPGEQAIFSGELEQVYPTTFPSGEGTDFAGVIETVGEGVEAFKVGDAVVGFSNERSSQAELVCVPQTQVTPKPDSVSWEAAGGLMVAGTTAYASVRAQDPQANEIVVVAGASGAVGLLTAQLAKLRGCRVIGLASPNYHDWLQTHDIEPIDYHGDVKVALEAAGTIDHFFDCVGGGYVKLAIELGIAPEHINTVKDFAGAQEYGVQAVGGMAAIDIAVVAELVSLMAEGKLELPVAKTFPLADVRQAFEYQMTKHDIGKVVLVL